MKWILIIVLSSGWGAGITTTAIEFNNSGACLYAMNKIKSHLVGMNGRHKATEMEAICVEKGEDFTK